MAGWLRFNADDIRVSIQIVENNRKLKEYSVARPWKVLTGKMKQYYALDKPWKL